MAPNSCWIASGDSSGVVKVWACDQPDRTDVPVKLETAVMSGEILDISWSPDSTRIAIGGNGKSVVAKVIMWDSGNSVGDMGNHTKKVNSITFKSSRPFRVVTGGEDCLVNYYSGPPFKYTKRSKQHERFVNVVRFSPDGSQFLSASSDMCIALYDGKEGDEILCKKVHSGSIFGADWSADGSKIVTASGDKTIKVHSAADLSELSCISFGKTVEDMQVGCLWTAHGLLSYSLRGEFLVSQPDAPDAKRLVQLGHNRAISSLAWMANGGKLVSGSYISLDEMSGKGCMRVWDLSSGIASTMEGTGHSSRVIGMAAFGDLVCTIGGDDCLMFSSLNEHLAKVELGCQPMGIACGSSFGVVLTRNQDLIFFSKSMKLDKTLKLDCCGTCVAVSPSDDLIAVGAEDNFVYMFDTGCNLKFKLEQHRGVLSCLSFSPGGDKLVSGCANKELAVWEAKTGTLLNKGLSGFHLARISSIAWSPAGSHFATGGVDCSVLIWENMPEIKSPKHSLKLAHPGGVTALAFTDEGTVASAGLDACIRTWSL
mmetsp:Transcript_17184/g.28802  ORF Transcript_17184/g.28802 Transcript_17184/m.28802 type:complete len:540 (-) Transcript_17184:456-2075(-)